MPKFREHDERYLRCTNCGECVARPEKARSYDETPSTHTCVFYDETGGVPAGGF